MNDWGSAFCPDCGQKLDWTPEPEPDKFEEAFEQLREIVKKEEAEE